MNVNAESPCAKHRDAMPLPVIDATRLCLLAIMGILFLLYKSLLCR